MCMAFAQKVMQTGIREGGYKRPRRVELEINFFMLTQFFNVLIRSYVKILNEGHVARIILLTRKTKFGLLLPPASALLNPQPISLLPRSPTALILTLHLHYTCITMTPH
jgi:hypothetical protein